MKISLSSRRLAAAVGVLLPLLAPAVAGAQSKTTIRDRARQEAVKQVTSDESRFSVLDGVVTDSLLRPLNSADVTVVGTGARVVTSENGRFRMLQVPPGQYLLIVRRIGFAPTSGMIEVPARDTLRLSYVLERSNNMLDTMRIRGTRVTMRMREFEQRRQQGVGQFVTQEEIERRGSLATADFLRYMRGVEVSQVTTQLWGGTQVYSRREGAGMSDGVGANCAMQVLLDGIILPKNFNLDLLPPPKQIAGIEVYSGAATMPPQFGGPDRRCGAVAFWTRDGYN
ncbi:MAG TPA: hypothetical protein DGD08_03040 [Gemmatimonas aurantiaca]|uniref:TonB-dependent receptor plug domain-containing protein n=2 Tax=Gemmatimonas aurantiaca TaxID=173480 RepID=C1A8E4_GEMAT|nr:carboxypeptidase-like regulatory domain-containing protein [Gemmatimonas aurantiaca]BAH38504.1 hypothetical protein GAU_1462 [Gemmatimonas aurantiaca T-27]HCT56169.1 hypothetical protein [Gemmatimonas aurantiaca]